MTNKRRQHGHQGRTGQTATVSAPGVLPFVLATMNHRGRQCSAFTLKNQLTTTGKLEESAPKAGETTNGRGHRGQNMHVHTISNDFQRFIAAIPGPGYGSNGAAISPAAVPWNPGENLAHGGIMAIVATVTGRKFFVSWLGPQ